MPLLDRSNFSQYKIIKIKNDVVITTKEVLYKKE